MLQFKKYILSSSVILTRELFSAYVHNFWTDIFDTIVGTNKSCKHLMIMCRVVFEDSKLGHRTIGHLRKVNFSDKDLYIEYLTSILGLLTESYSVHPIKEILFTYIVKDGEALGDRALLQEANHSDKASSHKFNNMNLPISMNPTDYGNVLGVVNNGDLNRYFIQNNKRMYIIDMSLDGKINNVNIPDVNLSWCDTKISEDTFKREIGKTIFYYTKGKLVLSKKVLNAKPFAQVKKDKVLHNEFITMDIETINRNGKLHPYLICAYNGKDYITSYANQFLDQKDLFIEFIDKMWDKLTTKKVNIVYAHNLSGFDGIFLLKHLLPHGDVKPLLFNGKLMSIKFKSKGRTIIFKDSYLLLSMSLRALCKAFNITVPKAHFPFDLSDIFYRGPLPDISYWPDLSLEEYENISSKYKDGASWSFIDEAIKYCKLDCKVLHEILVKFNELIFNNFNINVHSSLTLPALAMRIFKSNFMPKDTIYQLLGKADLDIRQSYTGGAVDAYIPHNSQEYGFGSDHRETLYYYDVNSLYPSVMTFDMPVGKPTYFEGDIRAVDPNAYGFFYCKITSPDYLPHPTLQRRVKTANGNRTIAGLGSWEGWIYSLEMDAAKLIGYKFEILRGYQYDKGNIFKEYIHTMYTLRRTYPKSDPMNLTAKLLMNSLYGKFGMRAESTIVEVYDILSELDKSKVRDIFSSYGESIKDYVQIDNHVIIQRDNLSNYNYDDNDDIYHGLDINVGIASAITAGARIWMSQLKNNPNFNLYYSDTDSIIIDKPLPSHLVGPELGKFKLECVIKRAVFLAPKVYGLITDTGEEIIKVKGLTAGTLKDFHIQDLESLLVKDSSISFNQDKWYKDLFNGDISIKNVAYRLQCTNNKRHPIYIDNVFHSTQPINYNNIN